ncbi:MAG: hypothetical protein HYX75_11420 [Acidobacteria bacterium]|nr:hypothetical protein [Acidobacteriota bacterium]
MALINNATREITAKIVYYGPGLGGKTTNLKSIFDTLPVERKGKMISLATETDRTLFFDFLPIELGRIKDFKTRVQLYTVPGQVFYDATRKLVLQGVDGVVFVADSQAEMLQSDEESMENLRTNLAEKRIDLSDIPLVLQFNKRDLPNILSVSSMNERLNRHRWPYFEASALRGDGVNETFHAICRLVLESLSGKFVSAERETAAPTFKKYTPSEEEQPVVEEPESVDVLPGEDEMLEPGSARLKTEEVLAHSLEAEGAESFPMDTESDQTFTSLPRPDFEQLELKPRRAQMEDDFISLSDLEEIADIHEIVGADGARDILKRPHETLTPEPARPEPETPAPPMPGPLAGSPRPSSTVSAILSAESARAPALTAPFDELEGPLDLGSAASEEPARSASAGAEIVVPVDISSLGIQSHPDSLEIRFTIKLVFKTPIVE